MSTFRRDEACSPFWTLNTPLIWAISGFSVPRSSLNRPLFRPETSGSVVTLADLRDHGGGDQQCDRYIVRQSRRRAASRADSARQHMGLTPQRTSCTGTPRSTPFSDTCNKAIIDIRLRPRCATPPHPRSRLITDSSNACSQASVQACHCMDQSNSQFIGVLGLSGTFSTEIAYSPSGIVTPT